MNMNEEIRRRLAGRRSPVPDPPNANIDDAAGSRDPGLGGAADASGGNDGSHALGETEGVNEGLRALFRERRRRGAW
jgi:hypothetical protein